MDSLTHIALGACTGEAFFEKGFGKKAMFWGALAQSIPDIDFMASLWMNTPESLLAHRGFTHSLLFVFIIVPAFAITASQIHKPHDIAFNKWLLFFLTEILIHLFVDAFNNYGIGWFEPFSHHRFSFNIIYVADPFFSIPVFTAFVTLVLLDKYDIRRKLCWQIGLLVPFFYLAYCTFNKIQIENIVTSNKSKIKISGKKYFTTPAPLQNWLWYIVIKDTSGYYIGYKSLFEKNKNIAFHFFKSNHELLYDVSDHESLQKLIRFSKDYYIAEKWGDTLVFNDLRFGQILGWRNPSNHFVFHYYLSHSEKNGLVVQRGRFSDWSSSELRIFLKRVFDY